MSNERLYGLPGAEHMYFDEAEVYETDIEPYLDGHDRRPRIIEEWTVHPPTVHLPKAEHIVESVIEWACDNAEVDEGWSDKAPEPTDPKMLAAAEALREAIAEKVTYRMANKKVAEHVVTWADDDEDMSEPLIGGERLYRPARV